MVPDVEANGAFNMRAAVGEETFQNPRQIRSLTTFDVSIGAKPFSRLDLKVPASPSQSSSPGADQRASKPEVARRLRGGLYH